METYRFTDVHVEQESVTETDRAKEQGDYILVKIWLCVATFDRHGPYGRRERRSREVLYATHCRVLLGLLEKKRSPYRRVCRCFFADRISEKDTLINIPKEAHSKALCKLFQAFDAAVNPELPIKLEIWDLTEHTWELPCAMNFVPATRDSIDGLERVRLQVVGGEECAICLEDYDQPAGAEVVVTRLPCAHYFHTDCAALWLHTNHICPLCRFALPTTPQQP